MGKLTPVRPKAIRAPVSSFNVSQAGVASEIKALLGDTTEALSKDSTEALSEDATEALSGDTRERLGKVFPSKGE